MPIWELIQFNGSIKSGNHGNYLNYVRHGEDNPNQRHYLNHLRKEKRFNKYFQKGDYFMPYHRDDHMEKSPVVILVKEEFPVHVQLPFMFQDLNLAEASGDDTRT